MSTTPGLTSNQTPSVYSYGGPQRPQQTVLPQAVPAATRSESAPANRNGRETANATQPSGRSGRAAAIEPASGAAGTANANAAATASNDRGGSRDRSQGLLARGSLVNITV